jgi:hypothetical protein
MRRCFKKNRKTEKKNSALCIKCGIKAGQKAKKIKKFKNTRKIA